ncbi:hypothetical protein [Streptomyces roseochromogenus]|uniref:Uncharacterized protein n=1 Tax=Streptomyces roseochromogenus subsp. oscitans DS 12.976 TaxID=1352936 RepID=V6K1G0_STRRC|nr:hypothetical protein M878_27815 [Streptomyces roseochromogenus subsp. oscitans DS 12.976]
MQPGDIGVVERYVRLARAAHGDPPAVQQMDPARVRARHDMQLGRRAVQLGMRLGGRRGAQRQHGAVDQRRLAEGVAARIEACGARVQHHGRRTGVAARAALPGDRPGQRRRDRAEVRAGGRRDQHVTARGAAPLRGRAQRVYDGQPDLHRRQRSLLRGSARDGLPPTPHEHVGQYWKASSHLPLTTRPGPGDK